MLQALDKESCPNWFIFSYRLEQRNLEALQAAHNMMRAGQAESNFELFKEGREIYWRRSKAEETRVEAVAGLLEHYGLNEVPQHWIDHAAAIYEAELQEFLTIDQ